jgi:hypothetical protein
MLDEPLAEEGDSGDGDEPEHPAARMALRTIEVRSR